MSTPSSFVIRVAKIVASGLPSVCVEQNAKGGPVRFEINPDAPPGDLLGVLMPIVAKRLRDKAAAQKSQRADANLTPDAAQTSEPVVPPDATL